MNHRLFFFLFLLIFGNIPSLIPKDIKDADHSAKSSAESETDQLFFFESDSIVWKVDLKNGIVAAWDSQSDSPLWSEDGIVFRSQPNCLDIATHSNSGQIILPSTICLSSTNNQKEKMDSSTDINNNNLNNNFSDAVWIQAAKENSRISSIFGRIYILLDETETSLESKSLRNNADSQFKPVENPDIRKSNVRPKTQDKTDHENGITYNDFEKFDSKQQRFSKTLLIALDPQAEGRLVWKIRCSDLPIQNASFDAVPQEKNCREDFLFLPIKHQTAEKNHSDSLLQIDAATGKWDLIQNNLEF
ncbi:MAG: hypothetical protein Q4C95_12325 [Planctomycetia bacterium]|nr:hypothetical protein [Planctomycetia bacterium]